MLRAQEEARQTILPGTRSEEASGSLTNTAAEVAQHLRRFITASRTPTTARRSVQSK
jgi:hypothetical protein